MKQSAIERERDRILKADGFEDIEDTTAHSGLKSPANPERHVHRVEQLGPDGAGFRRHAAETSEYYRRASHFLWEREWYSDLERRCWELHCDGASYTRTVRTMKREGHSTIYRGRVHKLVTSLRVEMLRDELAEKRRPGRPKDPSAFRRGDAGALLVPHSPASALALDHVTATMKCSAKEAVRRCLILVARGITR